MNRRSMLSFCCTAAALSILSPVRAQSVGTAKKFGKIRAGITAAGPPFAYLQNGEFKGVTHDLLEIIAKANQIEVEWTALRFPAMIPALQAGQIDAAVSGFYVTEERLRIVDFTIPFFTQGSVVVVPVNSAIKSYADLRGKRIAVEQGSAASGVARKLAPGWGAELRVITDASSMKLAMQTGDVDALVYDAAIVAHQLKLEKDNPTQRIVGDVMEPTDIAIALQKGSELAPILNAGIKQVKENGDLARLLAAYDLA